MYLTNSGDAARAGSSASDSAFTAPCINGLPGLLLGPPAASNALRTASFESSCANRSAKALSLFARERLRCLSALVLLKT